LTICFMWLKPLCILSFYQSAKADCNKKNDNEQIKPFNSIG
jgi:hypothetical protein